MGVYANYIGMHTYMCISKYIGMRNIHSYAYKVSVCAYVGMNMYFRMYPPVS